MKVIKTGSDFSGVGAFDYAINRVAEKRGFKHQRIYACDWDKYARITYSLNHGEPEYYPEDVYDRKIPDQSLDIYMTSPPCQAFSHNGRRLGKDDPSGRGILFFNSYEFIQKNRPRFFIFENVRGLVSNDGGKTFQEWINMLGGKSVNGLPVIFPDQESVPYHLYYKIINSKDHGVPQNRERIFLIGIRDDEDNFFTFPPDEYLEKKLSDILEEDIDEKYMITDSMRDLILNPDEWMRGCVLIKSATKRGYEIAYPGDSINFSVPSSETRRGRVGKEVAQTILTSCDQGTIDGDELRRLTPRECFRLMDFPDHFDFSQVSETQAYKQAGNSIVVRVLEKILLQMKL